MSQPAETPAHPPIRIARFEVFVWRVAIAEPVQNAFGSQAARATASIRLEDADGAHGWGDIWGNFPAPTPDYRARLAAEVVLPRLIGRTVTDIRAFFATLEAETRLLALQSAEPGPFAAICCAVDAALWDLAGRKAGLPVHRLLNPASETAAVPCYASGINPGGAAETIARCRAEGYRAFKVKIGFGRERDLQALSAARDALEAGEALLTDANQAWSPVEAADMACALAQFDLEWLEEPMPVDESAAAWQRLRAALPMPLAGGENIRGLSEFDTAGAWLDVIQPDVGKWGGLTCAYEIGRRAVAAGKRYCPHWLSGGIGLIGSAHVLAAVGGSGRLEIDANPNPLRTALVPETVAVRDGLFRLPPGPGLGIEPDTAALAEALVWQAEVT
ncbi:MAG: mandelate racemase/muconate lactonizing enzyme family protein [Alphaproteobacteria bacterium]|nr:mandelate racemase/muconate lactonizing enzyme family protein [Alphaproteobacteria bacterium]MCB9930639.1 mandelate racemase/muconate lactonizing enzyme family protein [Alphaproteobacteria bacterium]